MQSFEAGTKAIYLKYYGLLEKRRWSIDEDIRWEEVKKHTGDLPLQEMLYVASLIESYTFTTTPQFLLQHKDKPWIMALQIARGYEECKHGNALWRYLECLGYPTNEKNISEIQDAPNPYQEMSLFERNVYAWLSEVETTVFYQKVSERLTDPVGQELLRFISQDERVHGSFLFDTIKLELSLEPQLQNRLMEILQDYQNPEKESHYGAAVGEATFRKIRNWAESVGVNQEVSQFVQQRLQSLAAA